MTEVQGPSLYGRKDQGKDYLVFWDVRPDPAGVIEIAIEKKRVESLLAQMDADPDGHNAPKPVPVTSAD